ncbi:type I polyketide synthase, partial [Streptomyces sp. CC224E]|uniref:type I polyketide synthase n=2 Tax=unclassified Streptomyces TaxID=2593676 RepID=UPI00278C4130
FQGLHRLWRHNDHIYAEITLPTEPDTFTIHPALLDATLHAALHAVRPEGLRLATTWRGVAVHAVGASALRVRIGPDRDGLVSVTLADAVGDPVAEFTVGTTPVEPGQLRAAGVVQLGVLHREAWVDHLVKASPRKAHWAVVGADPLRAAAGLTDAGVYVRAYPGLDALAEAGGDSPDYLLLTVSAGAEVVDAVRETLSRLNEVPSAERLTTTNVVFLTTAAVPAFDPADSDLAGAAVWGLVRSAQAENPGRFVLADIDTDEASWRALPRAVMSGEPQMALREGRVKVPRLAPGTPAGTTERFAGHEGTVLVTGGTTPRGERLARHLVAVHGVRHLLFIGAETPEPAAELTALGATVTTAACDPVDPAALRELIGRLPAKRPLTMAVHVPQAPPPTRILSAPPSQAPDPLAEAVGAAVAAAEVLDQEIGEAALVLCSSLAGTVGGSGLAATAASAAALDALARRRRARGAPALSLAWGPWTVDDARSRGENAGVGVLGVREAGALFDTACRADEPVWIPARLDLAELTRRAEAGEAPPPLFRSLVRTNGKRTASGGAVPVTALRQRLASMAEAEQDRTLSTLITAQISAVLGLEPADVVQPNQILLDFGFDSLSILTLRNRLDSATGVRLDTTSMSHRSTPDDLVQHFKQALLDNRSGRGVDNAPADDTV